MKVLSLTEPYATLIKEGNKKIETRSWKTSYRGKLYIHASSTKIPKEYRSNKELMALVDTNKLNYGNIICSCELVDCVEMTDEFIEKIKKNKKEFVSGVYSKGRYAWILKDIEALNEPIKAKGHLGIWNFDKEIK
ncbi:MAG: ASCH domain-containing protein [Bacilli bacterium]|nr:ASCH domain-containing protein [Bacilli bacterium]